MESHSDEKSVKFADPGDVADWRSGELANSSARSLKQNLGYGFGGCPPIVCAFGGLADRNPY